MYANNNLAQLALSLCSCFFCFCESIKCSKFRFCCPLIKNPIFWPRASTYHINLSFTLLHLLGDSII
uniref:Putative secreted protein n=1 Tax=Anopheles darlingi TaxID=43151 RepID=A0A2M4D4A6_ANODA